MPGTVLGGQLDAMVAQDPGVAWELIVVDNGSTDRTAEIAASYADRLPVRVVREGPARHQLRPQRGCGRHHRRRWCCSPTPTTSSAPSG